MRSNVLYFIFTTLDRTLSEVEGRNERLAILKKLIEAYKNKPEDIVVQTEIGSIIGGRIVFDFRSVDEFDDAAEAARSELAHMPRISHYILTDWDHWRIYEIVRDDDIVDLQLIFEGNRNAAIVALEDVLARELKELKVPPRPAVIATLYSLDIGELKEEMMDVLDSMLDDREVAPLFEAYKRIIDTLYPSEDLGFLKELYVNHTLMHMMVMASLSAALGRDGDEIDISSGSALPAGLNVALPYLNWWKIAFNRMSKEQQEAIGRVASNIVMRARMVDWSLDSGEDVFRELYQLLIEPRVRRNIGEYYTPVWLVDKILSEFTLKDKLVMDPFCGSGTFLVRAFHKKISEGEDADKAYEEVVGFDINPLAVAVARAELIISYVRAASKEELPSSPPRVYHADTLAAWFSDDPLQYTITKLLEIGPAKMNKLLRAAKKMESKDVLDVVANVERLLATGLENEEELADYMLNNLSEDNPLESSLKEIFADNDFIRSLADLKQYGDGVWAAVFSSLMSPIMLNVIRPDIIVTNPPWIHITELKTSYVKNIHETFRETLMKAIKKITSKRASSIASGSDVSIGALYKSLTIAREGVGFVMSKTQSFNSKSSVYAGIITAYAVLKSACKDCYIKLVDVQYDVFGHGVEPSLVITSRKREKRGAELYTLTPVRS